MRYCVRARACVDIVTVMTRPVVTRFNKHHTAFCHCLEHNTGMCVPESGRHSSITLPTSDTRPGMPLPVNNIFVGSRDHRQLCELDQPRPRTGDWGQQGPSFWPLLQLKASCVGVRGQARVTTMVIAFPLPAFLAAALSITLPSFRLLVQPTLS